MSRLVNRSPELRLTNHVQSEYSPHDRESHSIEPVSRPATKSKFQIVQVIGKPMNQTIDPYLGYVETFEGMTESERKASIFAEAQR